MAHTTYVVGLDIGTTQIKALAFSPRGELLSQHQERCPQLMLRAEFAEQDPEALYGISLLCLQKLAEHLGSPPQAVGICTFMHSLLLVDAQIRPLTNLILWSDRRSAALAQSLRTTDLGKKIYRQTGTPIHAMSPLSKIPWFQKNDPELIAKTQYFLDIKSYLIYKLTGQLAVDYSTASASGLMDIKSKKWLEEAVHWAGISPNQLPRLLPASEVLPAKNKDLAFTFSLVSGLSDGCAANLGALCLNPAQLNLSLGTSAALRFTSHQELLDEQGILFCYCMDDQDYVIGGASNNGGNLISWLSQWLQIPMEELESILRQENQAIQEELFFIPWLNGERAPIQLADSVAAFINMQRHHQRADFLQVGVISMLMNVRIIMEKLEKLQGQPFQKVYLNGGLTQVPVLTQFIADIFNKPVAIPKILECSALGAALFAARTMGFIDSFQSAQSWNPSQKYLEPHSKSVGRFEKIFQKFKKQANQYLQNKSSTYSLF